MTLSLPRSLSARAARLVGALALAGCARRAPAPEPAPAPASPSPAQQAARDSQYAADHVRTLSAYYQRAEWSYAGGRCAVTDSRTGRTTRFRCGHVRFGTRAAADGAALARLVRGRTVETHAGDAPWRVVSVPRETERAAILRLLEDPRVRWAGVAGQAVPARPRRASAAKRPAPRKTTRAAPAP